MAKRRMGIEWREQKTITYIIYLKKTHTHALIHAPQLHLLAQQTSSEANGTRVDTYFYVFFCCEMLMRRGFYAKKITFCCLFDV